MKKGAIHIDWVISIGIFLVYIIVLLVLIKPSYKPAYEESVLTTMIKDEFIEQNKIDAGFIVFKTKGCQGENQINIITKLLEKLPSGIDGTNIYVKPISGSDYKAYFLKGSTLGSGTFENCLADIGEVVYYNGLKESLNFETKDFKFPSSRNYKITTYPGENVIIPKKDGVAISMGEQSSDSKVYVLDWSSAKLKWENNEIKRDNIIINIQVW